jgi:hypothetical protein
MMKWIGKLKAKTESEESSNKMSESGSESETSVVRVDGWEDNGRQET